MQKKEKRKLTQLEKVILIICSVISVGSIIFTFDLYKIDIVKMLYKDHEPVALNLTKQQKLEDFEYYYDVMLSSFPMMEDYEKVLEIDFEEKKEYYREMVEKTSTDYEFFCVMSAIANEFPSFHTDLVFPQFTQYESLGCYNMSSTLCNDKVYPASVYWDNMLEEEYGKEEIRGTIYMSYKYINGDYILCGDAEGISSGTKLLEVNGTDVHEYVFENQFSSVAKKYDVENDRIYLQNFYTNNKFGESVTLTLQDDTGKVHYYETFCEKADSAVLYLDAAYSDYDPSSSVQNKVVYSHIDEARGVGYINMTTFNMLWAEDIAARIKEMDDCETIILDLRDNYGGVSMLPPKYIYPQLFTSDVSMNNKWYMLDSSSNRRVILEDILGLLFKFNFKKVEEEIDLEREKDYLYSYRNYNYVGEASKDRSIAVLISENTGSAADGFAAALKETDAIVVGQNTHGEGLADSFMCDYLPNSGLVFTYMFGKAFNGDGTDNSLFGTSPDIYSYMAVEDYQKRAEIMNAGEDPYIYENRLKWDKVLLEALKIIESQGDNLATE